jgi:hypothetical protein
MASVERRTRPNLKGMWCYRRRRRRKKKKKNYNCTSIQKLYHYNSGNTKCDKLL